MAILISILLLLAATLSLAYITGKYDNDDYHDNDEYTDDETTI